MQPPTLRSLQFLADPRKTEIKHVTTIKRQFYASFAYFGSKLAVSLPIQHDSYQNGLQYYFERHMIDGFIVDNDVSWKTETESAPRATLTRGPFIFERKMQGREFQLTVRTKSSKERQIEKIILEQSLFKTKCTCIPDQVHSKDCFFLRTFAKVDLCTARDLTGRLHLLVLAPVANSSEFTVTSYSEAF